MEPATCPSDLCTSGSGSRSRFFAARVPRVLHLDLPSFLLTLSRFLGLVVWAVVVQFGTLAHKYARRGAYPTSMPTLVQAQDQAKDERHLSSAASKLIAAFAFRVRSSGELWPVLIFVKCAVQPQC